MRLRRSRSSLLAGVAPFDRYRARDLRPLSAHVDWLRPRPGTLLAQEGRTARELVVVLAGGVIVSREGRIWGCRGPGVQIGGVELMTGTPHRHTAVAGPGLEVLVVNGPAYRWAARALPGLAAALRTSSVGQTAQGQLVGTSSHTQTT